MTVLHQIESSLEKTKLYQTEESLKWPCSTKLRKVLKMTVFHQIGKHFINDSTTFRNACVTPSREKFNQTEISLKLLCSIKLRKVLKMTVSHQIEKSLEMTAPQKWGKFKMTVFHQI